MKIIEKIFFGMTRTLGNFSHLLILPKHQSKHMTAEEKSNGLVQWGDEEFDDDAPDHQKPGTRVETEIRTNQQGQRMKVIRTIKTVKVTNRVNRIVEERRKRWVKFGSSSKMDGAHPERKHRIHVGEGEQEGSQEFRGANQERDERVRCPIVQADY
ncbi:uncharacterized protein LOC126320364 [Schistocerca gregaria]|uniref:uncharacterized protein LOC126320364 n=1 Tax=Schistocerca gregaria TaxID=7010 RepID=UPI00211EB5A7|nr:uncharacterized protein LOC126320364 [Schistocerca gregaria]